MNASAGRCSARRKSGRGAGGRPSCADKVDRDEVPVAGGRHGARPVRPEIGDPLLLSCQRPPTSWTPRLRHGRRAVREGRRRAGTQVDPDAISTSATFRRSARAALGIRAASAPGAQPDRDRALDDRLRAVGAGPGNDTLADLASEVGGLCAGLARSPAPFEGTGAMGNTSRRTVTRRHPAAARRAVPLGHTGHVTHRDARARAARCPGWRPWGATRLPRVGPGSTRWSAAAALALLSRARTSPAPGGRWPGRVSGEGHGKRECPAVDRSTSCPGLKNLDVRRVRSRREREANP